MYYFLSALLVVSPQPVFERLHQRIAELLGRHFHIAGGLIVFRVVIGRRDGCDGCNGENDTAKTTVAIVATVAERSETE